MGCLAAVNCQRERVIEHENDELARLRDELRASEQKRQQVRPQNKGKRKEREDLRQGRVCVHEKPRET